MTVRVRIVRSVFLVLMGIGIARAASADDDRTTVVCGAKAGERVTCAANTSGGVTLVKPLGTAACELGRT